MTEAEVAEALEVLGRLALPAHEPFRATGRHLPPADRTALMSAAIIIRWAVDEEDDRSLEEL